MIVFIIPAIVFYIFQEKEKFNLKNILLIITSFIILSLIIILTNVGESSLSNIFKIIQNFIIRDKLDIFVPNLSFWLIIPNLLLPLIILGIYQIIKEKKYFILAPLLIGVIFWVSYTFTEKVLIIDHYRVAMITSILAVIIAGFGLKWLAIMFLDRFNTLNIKIRKILPIVILLSFFILSLQYTERTNWIPLSINSPVSEYLIDEDIQIFQDLSEKRFIAPPWKALTVAIATGNYPLETKASTISNKTFSYLDFLNMSCSEKEKEIIKKKIEYLYIKKIDCSFLQKIKQSGEDLILYKYAK
jgi:hypothetical protein